MQSIWFWRKGCIMWKPTFFVTLALVVCTQNLVNGKQCIIISVICKIISKIALGTMYYFAVEQHHFSLPNESIFAWLVQLPWSCNTYLSHYVSNYQFIIVSWYSILLYKSISKKNILAKESSHHWFYPWFLAWKLNTATMWTLCYFPKPSWTLISKRSTTKQNKTKTTQQITATVAICTLA